MDIERVLEGIRSAAREAGAVMLEADHIEATRESKEGHANFVTSYDRRVQELLFERLSKLLPEAHFLGEEEGQERFLEEYRRGYTFVIDPIDGTTNFMRAFRPSVISIGLLKDGEPYLGVVYNPYEDVVFHAVKGCGAFRNGKPVRSAERALKDSLVLFGSSPYDISLQPATFRLLERYCAAALDVRRTGSAAWDLCLIASGVADVSFDFRLEIYDFMAGSVILSEAGGRVTNIYGEPMTYDGRSSLLAVSAGVAREGSAAVLARKES